MKKLALVAYVAAVHAALAFAVFVPTARVRLGIEIPGHAHIQAMRALHARSDPLVPPGAAIFLGDSITQGMPVDAVAPIAVNYGIGWQDTEELARSIPIYRSLSRAGSIFLNIGTNDMGRGRDMHYQFAKVLALLPDRPLVWSAIVPGTRGEKEIASANKIAREMCAQRPGCTFVDTWSFLADASGRPIAPLYVDAIHPGPAGYAKWVEVLRPHVSSPQARDSHRTR